MFKRMILTFVLQNHFLYSSKGPDCLNKCPKPLYISCRFVAIGGVAITSFRKTRINVSMHILNGRFSLFYDLHCCIFMNRIIKFNGSQLAKMKKSTFLACHCHKFSRMIFTALHVSFLLFYLQFSVKYIFPFPLFFT